MLSVTVWLLLYFTLWLLTAFRFVPWHCLWASAPVNAVGKGVSSVGKVSRLQAQEPRGELSHAFPPGRRVQSPSLLLAGISCSNFFNSCFPVCWPPAFGWQWSCLIYFWILVFSPGWVFSWCLLQDTMLNGHSSVLKKIFPSFQLFIK